MPAASPRLSAALAAALVALGAAPAQEPATTARADGSRAGACEPRDLGGHYGDDRVACERRTLTLSARRALRVDAGNDGGVTVRGADSTRVPVVVAVVRAHATSDAEAARVAAAVRLADDGRTLRAEGPAAGERGGRTWWTVSWRLTVPRHTNLEARTNNGGVRVAGVAGRLRLHTNNGGVTLDSVGGAVVAHTNNGGAVARLAGRAWDAAGLADAGLDLHSNNGRAVLHVPADYSARVHVATNHGPLAVDFPVTVHGRVHPSHLDLTLGAGGALVRATTNNGGARLARAE